MSVPALEAAALGGIQRVYGISPTTTRTFDGLIGESVADR
jgi:hypothetical protein